jgi:dipeptidyl aminopeptidase/acylaminoacyl peptidase
MLDAAMEARIDALLRRIDVPGDPDGAYLDASIAELLPHVRRARRQDRSWIGQRRREIAAIATPPRRWQPSPSPVPALVSLLVLAAIVVSLVAVLVGSARRLPAPFGLAANGELAYVANGHVFLADSAGGHPRQVTFDTGTQMDPAFSRDGTRLAYRRFAAPQVHVDADVADAVVMDADGSNPVVVAHAVKGLSHVAWSPDGRTIAFSGSIDGRPGNGWTVPANGTAPPTSFFSVPGAWDPVWSPDGTQLAIGADPGQLWVVGRDGSNPRRVSRGTYDEVGQRGEIAEWSPDGRSIVFTAGTPMATQVFVVGLDGAPERQISHGSRSRWTPPGRPMAACSRTCAPATARGLSS